jgi:hypothetical protein
MLPDCGQNRAAVRLRTEPPRCGCRADALPILEAELGRGSPVARQSDTQEAEMARAGLLWLLGIPIPILLLMWALGWLH